MIGVGLEPKHTAGADQPETGAYLELPLANDEAFFRKKRQRQQRGKNDGSASKDGVNAWSYIIQRHHLPYLMNDVRETRQHTKEKQTRRQFRSWFAGAEEQEWHDCQTGHRIPVKILRPGIVVAIQIKLEQRRERPDRHRSKYRCITSGAVAL